MKQKKAKEGGPKKSRLKSDINTSSLERQEYHLKESTAKFLSNIRYDDFK